MKLLIVLLSTGLLISSQFGVINSLPVIANPIIKTKQEITEHWVHSGSPNSQLTPKKNVHNQKVSAILDSSGESSGDVITATQEIPHVASDNGNKQNVDDKINNDFYFDAFSVSPISQTDFSSVTSKSPSYQEENGDDIQEGPISLSSTSVPVQWHEDDPNSEHDLNTDTNVGDYSGDIEYSGIEYTDITELLEKENSTNYHENSTNISMNMTTDSTNSSSFTDEPLSQKESYFTDNTQNASQSLSSSSVPKQWHENNTTYEYDLNTDTNVGDYSGDSENEYTDITKLKEKESATNFHENSNTSINVTNSTKSSFLIDEPLSQKDTYFTDNAQNTSQSVSVATTDNKETTSDLEMNTPSYPEMKTVTTPMATNKQTQTTDPRVDPTTVKSSIAPQTTNPGVDPTTVKSSIAPQTTNPGVDPTTVKSSIAPQTTNPGVDPTTVKSSIAPQTTNPGVDPTTVKSSIVPQTTNPGVDPTTVKSSIAPQTTNPGVDPTTVKSSIAPQTTNPGVDPTTVKSSIAPQTTNPGVDPTTVKSIIAPQTTNPGVDPTTVKSSIAPQTTNPGVDPTTVKSSIAPQTTNPGVDPTTVKSSIAPQTTNPGVDPTTVQSSVAPRRTNPGVDQTTVKSSIAPKTTKRDICTDNKQLENLLREIGQFRRYVMKLTQEHCTGIVKYMPTLYTRLIRPPYTRGTTPNANQCKSAALLFHHSGKKPLKLDEFRAYDNATEYLKTLTAHLSSIEEEIKETKGAIYKRIRHTCTGTEGHCDFRCMQSDKEADINFACQMHTNFGWHFFLLRYNVESLIYPEKADEVPIIPLDPYSFPNVKLRFYQFSLAGALLEHLDDSQTAISQNLLNC